MTKNITIHPNIYNELTDTMKSMRSNMEHLERQKGKILISFFQCFDRDFEKECIRRDKIPTELHISLNLEKYKEYLQPLITTHTNCNLPENTMIIFWPPTEKELLEETDNFHFKLNACSLPISMDLSH